MQTSGPNSPGTPYNPQPGGQPPWPQQQQQPPPPQMAAPGQPLVFRMHSGARTALNVVGGLLILLVVTIPFAVLVFVRTAGARIEITADELIFRNLMSKRWKLASLRRIGVLAVPVLARGIGGALARKKVGGDKAIHLCSIDDRGRKSSVLISMFERYPEIIQQVANLTRLQVEEVTSGAFGPKWPG